MGTNVPGTNSLENESSSILNYSSFVTIRAAHRLILSSLSVSFLVWGSQSAEPYSTVDLTKVK